MRYSALILLAVLSGVVQADPRFEVKFPDDPSPVIVQPTAGKSMMEAHSARRNRHVYFNLFPDGTIRGQGVLYAQDYRTVQAGDTVLKLPAWENTIDFFATLTVGQSADIAMPEGLVAQLKRLD